jgi:hypothetical protein
MTTYRTEAQPSGPDELAASMIPVACELACLVRDWDRKSIARRLGTLTPEQWPALVVVLAAMVPDDAPLPDLLGWLEPGTPQRDAMLGKAHGRAAKRQQRGLPLWGPLAALDREYQQRHRERNGGELAAAEDAA